MSEYEADILQWSVHQAALLRRRAAGEPVNEAELDWEHLAEEIEGAGRSQLSAVRSRLCIGNSEIAAPAHDTVPRVGYKALGRIYPAHPLRCTALEDDLAQRPSATADIKPPFPGGTPSHPTNLFATRWLQRPT